MVRELAPHVLGALLRRFGDFSAADDAVQEAQIAAAVQWPLQGVPDNPRGWLTRVAARRMIDLARAESARRAREAAMVDEAAAALPVCGYSMRLREMRASPGIAGSRRCAVICWSARDAEAAVLNYQAAAAAAASTPERNYLLMKAARLSQRRA